MIRRPAWVSISAVATRSNERMNFVVMLIIMLGVPWLGVWDTGVSTTGVAYRTANMAFMPLVGCAVVALEQAIVVMVARLLGDDVPAVLVGVGPTIHSRSSSTSGFEVRLVPIIGSNCITTTRTRGQRLRIIVAMSAGIAVLVAALVMVVTAKQLTWSGLQQQLPTRLAPDLLVVCIAAVAVFASGVQCCVIAVAESRDDILRMRRVLGAAVEAARDVERGAYDLAVDTARRGLEDAPGDVTLQSTLATALSCRNDPEAFALTESLIKQELPAYLRPGVLNNWAWQCYLRGTDELRGEADSASREAVEARPTLPSTLDTRGHVLLWNRRYDEAEACFHAAYKLATRASTRACSAGGLAMVCAATDRIDDARAWLDRARQADAAHPIVARAIAAVAPLDRI